MTRVGAVGYLNARPLVHGLDRQPGRIDLRFDVPSRCAALLHDAAIDVGLIPSIELFGGPGYEAVPGVAIASTGPVASVALFSRRPVEQIRSVALDSSSRTSAALTRILCARRFGISPTFETQGPDLPSMLERADAALIIGDAALFLDHEAAGAEKIDLGDEWTRMTGLPFVWAVWAGRPDALDAGTVRLLQDARDAGVEVTDELARTYVGGDPGRTGTAIRYLRENIQYHLTPSHRAGLERFYAFAREQGILPRSGELRFAAG